MCSSMMSFFAGRSRRCRRDGALAGLRQAGNAENVAGALVRHRVRAGASRARRAKQDCLVCPRHSTWSGLQNPDARDERLQAESACGAHFIQQSYAIEEPDDVACVGVFVDVLEVRIEGVVIEIEVGIGIAGRCQTSETWDDFVSTT